MSLLHQALKKAEKDKGTSPTDEVFVDAGEEEKRASPLRLYILIVLTIGAGIFALYFEVFRKEDQPIRPQAGTRAITTPLGIAGGPGVEDLAQQADQHLRDGKWQQAREVLEKWVILEPRRAEAYNNLGIAFKKLGMKDKAYEQYRKALAIDADYAEALNNIGVLQLSEGKLAEALIQFQRALELKPNYAEAYFHLALIDEAQGKMLEARSKFQKFLELSPQSEPKLIFDVKERIESLNSPTG